MGLLMRRSGTAAAEGRVSTFSYSPDEGDEYVFSLGIHKRRTSVVSQFYLYFDKDEAAECYLELCKLFNKENVKSEFERLIVK
jgi:hypothetical protein